MKKLNISVLVVLILFILGSCKFLNEKLGIGSSKKGSSGTAEMVFGWGGGFTAMIEEYHLTKDGTLKLGTETKKKVDAKSMKLILSSFKKVNFDKIKLNDPGNLYYFMASKVGDSEKRLIWNDQTQLPPEVKVAYEELMKITR